MRAKCNKSLICTINHRILGKIKLQFWNDESATKLERQHALVTMADCPKTTAFKKLDILPTFRKC